MSRSFVRRWSLRLLPLVAACGVTDPVQEAALESFMQSMSVASLEELVLVSSAQVEVSLLPGGFTAGTVSVRRDQFQPEERIQSRIDGLSAGPSGSGTFNLLLGGLEIEYNPQTRFWQGNVEIDEAAFVQAVMASLNSGDQPPVVVERSLPMEPQAPDDPSFAAEAVMLDGSGDPQIRMNIDADNLVLVANPPPGEPDGWLTVLSMLIQLRISDGTTVLEEHNNDFEEVEEFEGHVESVDLNTASFTLDDGTVVRLVDQTAVSDAEGHLKSLADVLAHLEEDEIVAAWGTGVVEGRDPLLLMAVKVAFKARAPEEPEVAEFEGVVASADLADMSMLLSDGTKVYVTNDTEVVAYNDGSPASLEDLCHALADGLEVVAWGVGKIDGVEPLVLEGIRVVFKAREHPRHEDFEGYVSSIDLTAGTVTFDNGLVVTVSNETEIEPYSDFSPGSLQDAFVALENGRTIFAWGYGEVISDDPIVVAPALLVFKAKVEDFEQDVVSIDLPSRSLTLKNGWIVALNDQTEVLAADNDSPATLDAAAAALVAGDRLRVWGIGYVLNYEPVTLDLIQITVRKVPPS